MSTNIEIANPLIPGAVDTPLDARSRAATLADVENIALPYVGMVFYVVATQKWYRVKTLKAKTIGAATVPNAAIDAYEEVPAGDMKKADYDADNDGVVDTAKTAQGIGGKTAAEVAAAVDAIGDLAPATPEADGLMSAADKARLDGLESGGTGMTDAERARLLPGNPESGNIAVYEQREEDPEGGVTYEVSGAGVSSLNGTYVRDVSLDAITGGESYAGPGEALMYRSSYGWYLTTETDYTMPYYYSEGTGDASLVTWTVAMGSDPTPEITRTKIAVSEWVAKDPSDLPIGGMTEAERTRLLPDDAADGDLAVCREGVARGNGENTRLLVQPIEAGGSITDSASGNAAPVGLVNYGVTVDENGDMVFNGTGGYIDIGSNKLPDTVLDVGKEWTLDILFYATTPKTNCFFGHGGSPRLDFLLSDSGGLSIGGGPDFGSGWSYNTWHLFTFELYLDGGTWKWTGFRNGAVVASGTWGTAAWRASELTIGADLTSYPYRNFAGKMRAVRIEQGATHRGQAFTPLALPWLPPAKAWQLLKASDVIVRNDADRFSFSGQLKPVSQSVAVSGSQTVVLDAAQYSRWILTGSGTATLDLENWEDGDKGELVIDTSAVTPVIPAEWVTLGADITTTPGLYVLEIAQVGTTVFYAIRYPNSGGTISSISDHISIVNGYWYLDGVSTGVAATGPKGDKGDAGATGYVTTVISANQPQSPVDGTIWIQP